jgi:hypothetical protein
MAAKFLCCLPLRLGVIVISFIQFLLCGGFAGLQWWALWYANENANDCKHVYLPPILVLEQPYSRHNYTIYEDDRYYCSVNIHCCNSGWVAWVNFIHLSVFLSINRLVVSWVLSSRRMAL